MKKLLSLLVLVLTICSTVQAMSMNLYSPVGTVGTIKGREAMVVDLGGTIGKVAVATMNVGAASVSDYGADFYAEDVNDPSKNGLTDGWYVPSKEELDALFDNLTFNEAGTGLEWKVTESSTLQIPGGELTESGEVYGYSGWYLTSTLEDGAYYNWVFQIDNRGHELKRSGTVSVNSGTWWCHIRPFHKIECTLLEGMKLNGILKSIENDANENHAIEFVTNATIVIDNMVSAVDSEVEIYASYLPDSKTLHLYAKEGESIVPQNYKKAYCVSAADSEEKAYAVYDRDTKTIYVCTSEKEFIAPSSLHRTFFELDKLTGVRNISAINTSNVTLMTEMFLGCSALISLDLSGLNTANVTDMSLMFYGCSTLTSLNFSGLNAAKVTDMVRMFCDCGDLTSVDFSGFNAANVRNMNYMCYGCRALTSLDLSGFNAANVWNMAYMFDGCRALTSLDLSGLNTVVNPITHSMFHDCIALAELITSKNFSGAIHTDMFLNTASKSGKCGITCTKTTMDDMIKYSRDTRMDTSLFFWNLLDDATGSIDFIDGEEYTSTVGKRYSQLTYKRTFNNTDWQPLYVPFQMEYDDWKDDFDVAAITNFHEYTDASGNLKKVELEVRYVKEGKRLRANTPYLIRAKSIGEKSIMVNETLLTYSTSRSISCSSTERTYTFTGTYQPVTGLKTKGYIYLSGNKLCQADNDQQVLKAQRWYLTIKDNGAMLDEATPPALAKAMSIRLLDDDETTGIEEISVLTSYNSDAISYGNGIYDLSGRKQNALRQGINIVRKTDGSVRKIMVK